MSIASRKSITLSGYDNDGQRLQIAFTPFSDSVSGDPDASGLVTLRNVNELHLTMPLAISKDQLLNALEQLGVIGPPCDCGYTAQRDPEIIAEPTDPEPTELQRLVRYRQACMDEGNHEGQLYYSRLISELTRCGSTIDLSGFQEVLKGGRRSAV